MSSNGPAIGHLSNCFFHPIDIGKRRTDADQRWVEGKQRLVAITRGRRDLQEAAAKLAWQRTVDFFKKHLSAS